MHSLADRWSNGLHRFARDKIQDGGPSLQKAENLKKDFEGWGKSEPLYHAMDRIKYYYMRRNETCRAPRYTLRSSLNRPSWPPLPRVSPRSKKLRPTEPGETEVSKVWPLPNDPPPSTTPRGMHFSYPRDIIAPVGCINRFGKGNNEGKTSRRYEVNSKRIM